MEYYQICGVWVKEIIYKRRKRWDSCNVIILGEENATKAKKY